MNPTETPSRRARVLGGLWGSLVGDALGVPVEFEDRATVQSAPVRGMRGFGTHDQPPGTWSDDSSLLLCSVESLLECGFHTEDIGQRFLRWYQDALWTPHGRIFDVGTTTASALGRIAGGVPAEQAGGDTPQSNGNGSLMRILPVCLWFAHAPVKQMLEMVERASAVTHRHPRSRMACDFHALLIRELLAGAAPRRAYSHALVEFGKTCESNTAWSAEREGFRFILAGDLDTQPESEIGSGGYVISTLTASIWCLLTTGSFEECVLRAVNLGGDTDTTGCVAGGLAGVRYGFEQVPEGWRRVLARQGDVEALFDRFAARLATKR